MTIRVSKSFPFEFNFYLGLFPLLSTLPFYEDIEYFSLDFGGRPRVNYCKGSIDSAHIESAGYVLGDDSNTEESSTIIDLPSPPSEVTTDPEQYFAFQLALYTKAQRDFLGPYISQQEFLRRSKDKTFFPKRLKSLRLNMERPELYLTPLLNCASVDTLWVKGAVVLIKDPDKPTEILQFPNVKNFTYRMRFAGRYKYIEKTQSQFPNVESFTLSAGGHQAWAARDLPNLPKLVYLESIWEMDQDRVEDETKNIETYLRMRLGKGDWEELKEATFYGISEYEGEFHDTRLTCSIRREACNYLFEWKCRKTKR
ncbi:hypothetical protein TWF718_003395 [Orbilia javanica]|uniref:Uncharacterized protein n=1 Tax=Orbilia javanica TaxID=47235 RepID=A0AAN8R903_9PEZI